jgi:hypothetical protein
MPLLNHETKVRIARWILWPLFALAWALLLRAAAFVWDTDCLDAWAYSLSGFCVAMAASACSEFVLADYKEKRAREGASNH